MGRQTPSFANGNSESLPRSVRMVLGSPRLKSYTVAGK
jgi:hypothetical protein